MKRIPSTISVQSLLHPSLENGVPTDSVNGLQIQLRATPSGTPSLRPKGRLLEGETSDFTLRKRVEKSRGSIHFDERERSRKREAWVGSANSKSKSVSPIFAMVSPNC